MASTDPTVITIDVETGNYSSVSYPTLAPANNPTFTGTVTATSASAVYLPTNTSIGVVTSSEISALDGITGNIQAQLNTINLASPAGDILLPSKTGNEPSSLIFEGGVPDDSETSITPQNPVQDFTFYLPAPAANTFAITGSTASPSNSYPQTVFVGDNLIQTLTNKTLTSPTLTSPTITGTVNGLNLPTSTSGTKISSVYFKKVTADTGNANSASPGGYLAPSGFPASTGVSSFPITANKTYYFKVMGLYGSALNSIFMHQQLNILDTNGSQQPSSGIAYSLLTLTESGTTAASNVHTSQSSTNWTTADTSVTLTNGISSGITTNTPLSFFIEGHFTPTLNGTFYYAFKPSGSGSTVVTVYQNTFITISEV